MFVDGLEVGNLVNTLGHSTDVGFGLERLVQVVEDKEFVHETSLFRQDVGPKCRDFIRALESMRENGVVPGSKGRNGMCRKVLREVLDELPTDVGFVEWIDPEKRLRDDKMRVAIKMLKRHATFSADLAVAPNATWINFYIIPEPVPNVKMILTIRIHRDLVGSNTQFLEY
jgi:hypothetical protein